MPELAAEQLLQRHFGYPSFRPLQARVIAAIEEGRDVLAVLPTGAGKSVCFQIPALRRSGPTVVVSPLISLMQDQVAAARARGLAAATLNSTLPAPAQRETLDRAAEGRLRLIYTSPERLARLVRELAERGIRPDLLAVDEAHCISEWGPDFRPAYRALGRLRRALGWPQVVALTGSATPAVRTDITRTLRLGARRSPRLILGSFDRPNLWFGVARVDTEAERLRALLATLRMSRELAIVYGPTRNLVEELSRVLNEAGHRAAPYHAGLTAPVRRDRLRQFLCGELGVVVATCAFGMGIDKPDVRLVVHWTLPATPEAYYQEAGRAGRDGSFARCLLLYRPGDAVLPRRQLQVTFPPEQLVEDVWHGRTSPDRIPAGVRASIERLRAELRPRQGRVDWAPVRRRRREAEARIATMDRYARDPRCRRRTLLRYFGERLPRCAGCDVCGRIPPPSVVNPETARRLTRLRLALGIRDTPWRGCLLEPRVLRHLAEAPPRSEAELAQFEGVGPILAARYARTILAALR